MSRPKQGDALDSLPPAKLVEIVSAPKVAKSEESKQTVKLSRKALRKIREFCLAHDITFQALVIEALNEKFSKLGGPTIDEMEQGD